MRKTHERARVWIKSLRCGSSRRWWTPAAFPRRGALEDQLGGRLLNRTTRRLALTEAGQLYYERAAAILTEIDEAHQAVLQLSATPRGTLRVTVPVVFGRLHVEIGR